MQKPREKQKEYQRAYYLKHRERLLKKQKQYNKQPHVKERQKKNLLTYYAKKLAEAHHEERGEGNERNRTTEVNDY